MEQDNFLQENQAVPVITPVKWMLYAIVASLPLIGFIMLLVWAFSNDGRVVRQNWAKGMLLYAVLLIVLYALFFVLFGAAMFAAAAGNGSY